MNHYRGAPTALLFFAPACFFLFRLKIFVKLQYNQNIMQKQLYTLLVAALSIFSIQLSAQQAGDLDPDFGVGGKVVTDVSPRGIENNLVAITLQPDGKIIAVGDSGHHGSGFTYSWVIRRYNADGSIDTAFNHTGMVVKSYMTPGIDESHPCSVLVQPDGKIVVGGYGWNGANNISYDFMVVRYKTNGDLDSTFGYNGLWATNTNNFGYASDVGGYLQLQSDGKILYAGNIGGNATVFRLNSDGTVDNTYNGGINSTLINGGACRVKASALQEDGKVIITGTSYLSPTSAVIARFDTAGVLDVTFSGDGADSFSIGVTGTEVFGMAIQDDGKIVLAGDTGTYLHYGFMVMRYNANGTIDNTFGDGGLSVYDMGPQGGIAYSVAIQSNGKIVAAGAGATTDRDFAILRLKANGLLDSTFNSTGIVLTDFGQTGENAVAVVIQPDGNILAGGVQNDINNSIRTNFVLARYFGDAPTGISAAINEGNITVFPNPFNNQLCVDGTIPGTEVVLVDMLGKELQRIKATSEKTTVNTAGLIPGIYLVSCRMGENRNAFKVVKF